MKTALLLIDIQNDYFEGGSMKLADSDLAGENAREILKKFRSRAWEVVHIKHLATRPDATYFLPNTVGAVIHSHVKPLAQEKVFVKHYPNSFRETDLEEYLRSKGVNDLVVCGMMTHMCVDATVRAARDYGFNVTVIGDACATKDQYILGKIVKSEDVHNSFLAALSYFYASITTTSEFLEMEQRSFSRSVPGADEAAVRS